MIVDPRFKAVLMNKTSAENDLKSAILTEPENSRRMDKVERSESLLPVITLLKPAVPCGMLLTI